MFKEGEEQYMGAESGKTIRTQVVGASIYRALYHVGVEYLRSKTVKEVKLQRCGIT